MIELHVIVTGPSEATVTAALVAAGILAPREGGIFPADPTTVYSPMPPALSGEASCLIRFQAVDQATVDTIMAVIGADNINRASAPLASIAGALQTKPDAWPPFAIEMGLIRLNLLAEWNAAVAAVALKPGATAADEAVPVRWKYAGYVTLEEGWIARITAQMRATLGWTAAQRNQFLTQLKARATAQMAALDD